MTSNAIAWNKLQEEARHNQEMEAQGRESQKISRENIQLGYANVGLGYSQLAESARHNAASEFENWRHNTAYEGEQNRHNITTEQLTARDLTRKEETETIKGGTYWVNTAVDLLGGRSNSLFATALGQGIELFQ